MSVSRAGERQQGEKLCRVPQGEIAKAKLKIAIDTLIPQVNSFEELLSRLQGLGYEITREICVLPCAGTGTVYPVKDYRADYTEDAIKERIEGKHTRAAKVPQADRGVSLLIDIENSIKAAQSRAMNNGRKSTI